MTAATSALEIACAKPGCHWKGAPADAPGHPCPTPAADATMEEKAEAAAARGAKIPQVVSPFAGMIGADGRPIADPTPPGERRDYWVVWTSDDGNEVVIVGTRDTEADAIALSQELQTEGIKLGALTVRQVVKPEPAPVEPAPVEVTPDAEPETRAELEAWLLEHGSYDDAGVPQDEKTARLDARLSAFETDDPVEVDEDEDAEPELEPAAEAEPELAVGPDPVPLRPEVGPPTPGDHEDAARLEAAYGTPWETIIARELESQTAVKEYRWLVVVHHDDGRTTLLGRGKVKTEATVIAEDAEHRGILHGKIDVVKAKDVLDAAAAQAIEIEKRRELIDEPDRVVEPEPSLEPEPEPEPEEAEQETESAAAIQAAAEAADKVKPDPKGKSLFDASDFDREDLALPKVDGHGIDRIAISLGGDVMLDRSNPAHVALWRRMKLGREVEVWATVKGLGFTGAGATNRDGDLDVVVGKRSVKVQSLRIIEPEQMEEAIRELALQARDANEAGEDGLEEVGVNA